MGTTVALSLADERQCGLFSLLLADAQIDLIRCDDPTELGQLLAFRPCDLCVLSSRGIDSDRATLLDIKRALPRAKILLLCDKDALEDTLPLFREGLDDILIQPIKPKTAVESIRRLLPQAAGGARSTQSHFQSPDLPTAPTDPGDRRRLVVAKSASMLACLNQMEPLYLDTCTGLVRGPPGSEFELLARDLQAAWGTREHAVRVLRSPQLNPETFSALLENPTEPTRQVCFLPDIESCDETRQDAVLDFLRALRADRAARARLRVLFSTTAISGDSSASESDNLFVEELQFLVPTVVDLPPLHQRAADIPALAHAILTDLTRLFPTIRPRSLHPAAIDWLQREPWPGNYEELVGRLHRSMLQCERLELMPRDFQCYFERPAEGMPEIRLTTHLAL